jgi:hypothetical protein
MVSDVSFTKIRGHISTSAKIRQQSDLRTRVSVRISSVTLDFFNGVKNVQREAVEKNKTYNTTNTLLQKDLLFRYNETN